MTTALRGEVIRVGLFAHMAVIGRKEAGQGNGTRARLSVAAVCSAKLHSQLKNVTCADSKKVRRGENKGNYPFAFSQTVTLRIRFIQLILCLIVGSLDDHSSVQTATGKTS